MIGKIWSSPGSLEVLLDLALIGAWVMHDSFLLGGGAAFGFIAYNIWLWMAYPGRTSYTDRGGT